MSGKHTFQRAHLRAPLKTKILYLDDEFVFQAYTQNISEGGVLLENLPHVPEINAIPMMISLVNFPELSLLGKETLLSLHLKDLHRDIIRMKARIVRSFEGQSDVDKIFVTKIGCEFVKPGDEEQALIDQYVSRFAKNLIFLLNIFEGRGFKGDRKPLIRKVASLLGYDGEMQIAQLRLKCLHDYQSLESV